MIAREGWVFILIGVSLTLVSIWIAARWNNWQMFVLSLLFGILTLFTTYFFRDPERSVPSQPNALVSVGDGRVVAIDTLQSHPFMGENSVRVSVFLSVFDVHVNRIPATGTIDYVDYHKGKFFAAFEDKASEKNERTEIGMTTVSGHRVVFVQIAGLIARRIVCKLSEGDSVDAGNRFGLIRFGSRVDLIVPANTELLVKEGDGVYGGETVIANFSVVDKSHPDHKDRLEGDNARL